ncbi:hypothetical protein BGZ58_009882 [Dissophora ornata]|nr:hypothetical protein BGZ58_009882 [Dissophora ornata]
MYVRDIPGLISQSSILPCLYRFLRPRWRICDDKSKVDESSSLENALQAKPQLEDEEDVQTGEKGMADMAK